MDKESALSSLEQELRREREYHEDLRLQMEAVKAKESLAAEERREEERRRERERQECERALRERNESLSQAVERQEGRDCFSLSLSLSFLSFFLYFTFFVFFGLCFISILPFSMKRSLPIIEISLSFFSVSKIPS
jgi:hypothetical protein